MKYIAVAATTNETSLFFTLENLNQLADSAVDKPVLLNFNQNELLGVVVGAYVSSENQLIVEFELSSKINLNSTYLVPGYCVENSGKMKSLCYGITTTPIDDTLSFVQPPI